MGMFKEDCKRLLDEDFLTCLQRVGEYAETYKTLKTDGEKAQGLFALMLSLKLHD